MESMPIEKKVQQKVQLKSGNKSKSSAKKAASITVASKKKATAPIKEIKIATSPK